MGVKPPVMTWVEDSKTVTQRIIDSKRVTEPDPTEYDQPAHYNESGLYTWQERLAHVMGRKTGR